MSANKSPIPYFDTLAEMPNPFKEPVSSLDHLMPDPSADALLDYQHASEFIYSYRGSPDTFSTYRREVEHFLHWCWLVAHKSLAQLVREDIETYVEFSKQPPTTWIGKKNVPRLLDKNGERVPNPDWRPYVCQRGEYVASQAAIQSLFSVLSSFFNFLIHIFLIENFIEPYHVQFVHKKTTNQPLKDHYTIVDGLCYGSGVDVNQEDNHNKSALSVSSKYLSLFPNFIIGTYYPNQIGVYLNIPINAESTTQKRVIYTIDGKSMSKEEIDITKKIWWSVHKEDHEMCERLQEGRHSPASYEGGLLSPVWEKGVQAFQKLIVDATMKSSKSIKRKKNV